MKLLSISAKNYRTLQDIRLPFSRGYCTISGKNNAGKSSVIRLLSILFRRTGELPWFDEDLRLHFKEDRTQWAKQNGPIEIAYQLELAKDDDPALISFIEKMASVKCSTATVPLEFRYVVSEADKLKVTVLFDNAAVDDKAGKEIDKKVKDSNLLFLYNSTIRHEGLYFSGGRRRMFYEFVMSRDDKKELDEAAQSMERRLRRLAKQHREGLNDMLGRLKERFDVEFSTPERFADRHTPIGINLRDKHVEVPLDDWGSGTQNRTQILMAILQANRIKTTDSPDEKITPVVVIEEPESFLHPSAQSEFGRILRALSEEFGVQIIVTTHSPYMLNRENPASNILLCRDSRRGKAYETRTVDTAGNGWMAPFAEHLGIDPAEFSSWRPVFSAYKSKVLLVEGDIDKQYFELLQQRSMPIEGLCKDVEIVPYGGKDTLKNTLLVQFVLSKFDQVFITYDLDAEAEVRSALTRLGLQETQKFSALGLNQPGKDCIEGLLPERVLAAVNGRETGLVMKLGSRERRDAKNDLKRMYFEEFRQQTDYTKEELKELGRILKIINRSFGKM